MHRRLRRGHRNQEIRGVHTMGSKFDREPVIVCELCVLCYRNVVSVVPLLRCRAILLSRCLVILFPCLFAVMLFYYHTISCNISAVVAVVTLFLLPQYWTPRALLESRISYTTLGIY